MEAYSLRGSALFSLGQYQQSLADFSQVIEARPDDARGYYNRGLAHELAGFRARAIEDLQQAPNRETDAQMRSQNQDVLAQLYAAEAQTATPAP